MIKTKSALSDNQMVVRAIKDSFIKGYVTTNS